MVILHNGLISTSTIFLIAMPRTRQTAQKSTGGSAPRSSWREQKASSDAHVELRAQLRNKMRDQVRANALQVAEKQPEPMEYSENVSLWFSDIARLIICSSFPVMLHLFERRQAAHLRQVSPGRL